MRGPSSQTYSVERIPRATGSRCVENITSPGIQPQVLNYFGRVPVREQTIGTKIFVYLDEVHFALGLLARARRPGLAIAHDPALARDPPCLDQRPQVPESPTSHSIRGWPPGAPQAAPCRKAQAIRKPPSPAFRGAGTGSWYHCANVSPSWKRNAPLKSTTRCPASTSLGTSSRDASCGVARNVTPGPAGHYRFHREWPAGRLTPAAQLRKNIGQTIHRRLALSRR